MYNICMLKTIKHNERNKRPTWREILCLWIWRFSIIKMSKRFEAISMKIQHSFSVEINKLILKIICKRQRNLAYTKQFWTKKNKAWSLIVAPNFKTKCKVTVIQRVCGIGKIDTKSMKYTRVQKKTHTNIVN